MYLAIDIGNSRAKAGFFEHDTLVRKEDVAHANFLLSSESMQTLRPSFVTYPASWKMMS